ncbi:hypothetical protein GT037_009550 [Alternaria burnsii]|uniref:Uncharacterized protein n=1 Tax=Alternaria burnsii TaxID=1187904 RepID=A0A8H7B091_9PLEO|nr:uncharacterized protein GT037_009550 [Alternaria burnsii]KAF7672519.1 hypothetical protein GT037_009550 [Alternaria burnsii]
MLPEFTVKVQRGGEILIQSTDGTTVPIIISKDVQLASLDNGVCIYIPNENIPHTRALASVDRALHERDPADVRSLNVILEKSRLLAKTLFEHGLKKWKDGKLELIKPVTAGATGGLAGYSMAGCFALHFATTTTTVSIPVSTSGGVATALSTTTTKSLTVKAGFAKTAATAKATASSKAAMASKAAVAGTKTAAAGTKAGVVSTKAAVGGKALIGGKAILVLKFVPAVAVVAGATYGIYRYRKYSKHRKAEKLSRQAPQDDMDEVEDSEEDDEDENKGEGKDYSSMHEKGILVGIEDYKPQEQWLCASARSSRQVVVWESTQDIPYLSIQIPGLIQRIVFTIESNDQGWCSERRTSSDPYHGSWTWFEAGIQRRNPESRALPRWSIQKNVAASSTPRKHTVLFDRNSSEFQLQCWLAIIEQGDTLEVFPKARFPGWANHVKSIEMNVFYV